MGGLADWNDEKGHLYVLSHFFVSFCWWCGKGTNVANRKCRGGK